MKRRIAAIGLDAAEWTLVQAMMADGELPHLAALRERSVEASLHHPDYRTGIVWEHFLTGKSASGNRRWSAVEFDPTTYDAWQLGGRKLVPFYANDRWRDGDGERRLTTIAFDVPYTTLTGDVDGAEITSWGGHDPGYPRAARPAGLVREIDSVFGPHPALNNDYELVWYRPELLDMLSDALVVGARRRADISLWLQRRFPDWDLFVTVMSEPHSAGELMWHGVDPSHPAAGTPTAALAGRRLKEVYRAVDDAIGRLVVAMPPDTTIAVFSMFGMGPNDADLASMTLLPELLHRLHFGRPFLADPDQGAWRAAGCPAVVLDSQQDWSAYMSGLMPLEPRGLKDRIRRSVPSPVLRAYRAGRKAWAAGRKTPGPTRARGRVGVLGIPIPEETGLSPDDIGEDTRSLAWQIPFAYRGFWPRMRAFALPTFYDGRIRINMKGRERDGVVDPEDYRRTCEDVVEKVRACRNPRTGRSPVADVTYLRAGDPMDPEGPEADIQVVWEGVADAFEHPEVGIIGPYPFRRTGGHSSNGFLFLSGPGIDRRDLGARAAVDVTATLFALTGRMPDGNLEGTPVMTPGTIGGAHRG